MVLMSIHIIAIASHSTCPLEIKIMVIVAKLHGVGITHHAEESGIKSQSTEQLLVYIAMYH